MQCYSYKSYLIEDLVKWENSNNAADIINGAGAIRRADAPSVVGAWPRVGPCLRSWSMIRPQPAIGSGSESMKSGRATRRAVQPD